MNSINSSNNLSMKSQTNFNFNSTKNKRMKESELSSDNFQKLKGSMPKGFRSSVISTQNHNHI